ncbi:hypothetical protein AAC387_Pa03g0161 [Persea americana]
MVPAHEMEQIQEPDRRNLQLCFESRLPESFFTGKKVEGQLGELIPVKLIDRSTGHVVASGPLSSLKLDVVVLPGDFKNEDDDVRTWENFKSHVVKERKGKGPLLAGDLQVSLKEGVGYLGELKFTDNSSWTQSRKFKLGVKVASGFYEGIRVREAITDAFKVKDRRGISYKKHDQPALNDEVWRLKNIAKKGAFYEKLKNAGILKVEDCVWKLGTDPQGLRKILGSSMSDRMWETLVEHIKTCDRSGKDYVYYADSGEYYSAENLSDSQKVFADTLKKEAYAKWKDVIEYDGLQPLEMNPSKRAPHGGHFEGGGEFFWPRGGGGYPIPKRGQKRRSIFYKVTKVILELLCPSLGSDVKMEGGNTSSPLFEREEFREMPSLDSKFEGLSVAGPVV